MDFRFRVASAACAIVLLLGVVSTFAVSGDDQGVGTDDPTEDAADAASVVSDDATSTTAETTTTASADPDDDESATSTTDVTTPPATSSTATSRPTTTAPATTAPADVPVGVTATTPGSYTYDVSGTVDGKPVSGTSTLTVPAPDASGSQIQSQSGPEGSTAMTYRFTPEGTYLDTISMSAQGQDFRLTAETPFLIIPAGATAGTRAEGRLTGSGLTADVVFTLTELNDDEATATIDADITGSMYGCNVNGDMTNTITARTSDQLPLETLSSTDVRVSGCLFNMTSTADTRSVLHR